MSQSRPRTVTIRMNRYRTLDKQNPPKNLVGGVVSAVGKVAQFVVNCATSEGIALSKEQLI